MSMPRRPAPIAALILAGGLAALAAQGTPRRNVILFIADGLRHDAVNAADTPALWRVRQTGVHFTNSHALFPTLTAANATALATGHGLGDTGVYGNNEWFGFPSFATGNFGRTPGNPTLFLENDQLLADLNTHFRGNLAGEESLLSVAAAHGVEIAMVGKSGPAAIQDLEALATAGGSFVDPPRALLVDDATGSANGVPLPPAFVARLRAAGLPAEAPGRTNGYGATSPYNNAYTGDGTHPGTLAANVVQQQWFVDVTTRAILPLWVERDRPFMLVFWSRDPDASQHDHGDSLNRLSPGINGPTSRLGVRNADRSLDQLLAWLDGHPAVKARTDVLVVSDHGFATISRREIDAAGRLTTAESAKHIYRDANGRPEHEIGTLPQGAFAIDLALALKLNLFDPDRRNPAGAATPYRQLRMEGDDWEHPAAGHGFLGPTVLSLDGSDAKVIVVSDSAAEFVYVPDGSADVVRRVVSVALTLDYAGGIFVDDRFGAVPGALPMSAIGLEGAGQLPRPAVIVALKVFYLDPRNLLTGIQVTEAAFQEGQGFHGGFGRECTFNNMAAMGPDFRTRLVDALPVGNADVAPTIAHILGLTLTPKGSLTGRVMREALVGGGGAPAPPAAVRPERLLSAAAGGLQTLIEFQQFDGRRYLDAGCFVPQESAAGCR